MKWIGGGIEMEHRTCVMAYFGKLDDATKDALSNARALKGMEAGATEGVISGHIRHEH